MRNFFLLSGFYGFYKLLHEKRIALVALIYFFISAFILYRYGINTNGEAGKYIEDANRILHGENLRIDFFSYFYFTYSLLISFFLYFSFSFYGIACIQILFSFIAACCIYKLLLSVTADKKISLIAFIVYLVCFPIQKWNFFLYTESLHVSFTVIGLYFLYSVFINNFRKRWWLLLILLLLIVFSRPVGLIFVIAFFAVALIWLVKTQTKIIYYSLAIVCILITALLLQSKFIFYFNPDSLKRMEVICQVPQVNSGIDYKEYNASGLSSFFHVIFSEIGIKNFLVLGIKKLLSFFGMERSFYSNIHNIILLCTKIMLYPLAIIGLCFSKIKKGYCLKTFSLFYILITSVGIFFTCDEWSNRFIAPLLPHIIILSGMGLYFLKLKLKSFK